ncbi:MAG TPA: aldehyde dehydrogenase family protein [Stellaceae bacterium]|nr:aldehyde dehydrogenase family protein [Stellaceae bacterium]
MSEARQVEVLDPRTGKVDLVLDCADVGQVKAKADQLRARQPAWAALGVEGRVAVLRRWSEALNRYGKAIGEADARDTGGALSRQVPQIVQGFIAAHTAAASTQYKAMFREGVSPGMPHVRYDTVLKPFPLVGVISPWNAPTMLTMHRSILPLLAGCAVLVKPSEVTPRFVAPLKASMADVPELDAAFDFVLGDGATGAALVEQVDFISFTGSMPNGRKVAQACAGRFIPCELELGGKDPLIVTATANIDDAVSATVRGALSGTGQVCFSIERVYVERPIYTRYLAALTERVGKVRLRHPNPNEGEIGPFTMRRQASIVDAHLDDALAKGAQIVTGGRSFELDGGLYMKPTILTGVTHDMRIMREETFGPVIPVMAYDTPDEAVALANDTDFGLSAAVIAGTDAEATAIASRINAGNLSVQDSFLTFAAAPAESDSFGASGLGGKRSGIQRYLKRQALLHNTARPICLTELPRMAAE